MRCVYCDKELKSSADDYKGCICSECKKPKYPFQQGIIEQQNKIAELEQENKQLKEQLTEQIDYKYEYYHYWQETKKELAQFTDYLDRLGFNNFNDFEEWMGTFILTPHEEQTLIKELKEQLAIREKALELKVKKQLENVHYVWIDDKCFSNEQDLINYWLEQAKESIYEDRNKI